MAMNFPELTDRNRPMRSFLRAARLLLQGVRGAVFMKINPADVAGSLSSLVGLIAAGVVLNFAIDFASVGPQGEFSFYGLPPLLFKTPLILAVAWCLTIFSRKPEEAMQLAVLISAIAFIVGVLSDMLLWILGNRALSIHLEATGFYYPLHTHLVPVWLALASAVGCARLLKLTMKQFALAMVTSALLIWLPLAQVGPYNTLWTFPYDPDAMNSERAARKALTTEHAFYTQLPLLEHALESIRPSQSDRINLYFVGVAGDASQDVFMKEVLYVSNFFKAHFGTNGRSVTLINNAKSVETSPVASVTSLRQTLAKIGKVMDTDKDILFLYLTSHGSKQHRLTLDFGIIRFDELNPMVLRKLLDDSGIKHRVVVVSACYSGGFVRPLENTNTLVITAAAPDKTSYGCSNEADFTYFGKAYFEDGLRKTDSFIKAFEIAAPLIAQREALAGYEAAQPMISIGQNITPVLERYAAQEREAEQRIAAERANRQLDVANDLQRREER